MAELNTCVTFKSSVFNTNEPKEYFLNPCCYGDDVVKWLIQELQGRGYDVESEPEQVKFCWSLTFRSGGQSYDFTVACEDEGEWTGWITRSVGFLPLLLGAQWRGIQADAVQAIHAVLASSPDVQDLRWHKAGDLTAGTEE